MSQSKVLNRFLTQGEASTFTLEANLKYVQAKFDKRWILDTGFMARLKQTASVDT